MHYNERVDKIFNISLHKHRTLRTLFDVYSAEWNQTTLEQKKDLLEKIILSGYALENWIDDYYNFFVNELNKENAVESIDEALLLIKPSCKNETVIAEINKTTKTNQ
ncbi:MAG: hypothetical protein RL708_1363 [Bacteroidota bacterium]|jgi:hypothetical protein